MSLKNIDVESAMRRLADRQIEEAMRDGKFSNLAGMGEPLNLDPMPAEENARLAWWALRLLRQNDFIPDEVRWRKQIDALRAELAASCSEPQVRALVKSINTLVHRINTLGTNALNAPVCSVDLEGELVNLRNRQCSRSDG
jgi:hypothetical protein